MKVLLGGLAIATIALAGCESTDESDPALAEAVVGTEEAAAVEAPAVEGPSGYTLSLVTGTKPNGQPFTLQRATRTTWLYESGDTSVTLDVTDRGDTFMEFVGIDDWTGRIKIDLAAREVEVGDRDWSGVTTMQILTAN